MPPRSGDPLTKTTLNLFEADIATLRSYYGHGWSEQIRELVHQHVNTITGYHKLRKTLGDME